MLESLFSRNHSLLFLRAAVRITRGPMSASPAAKATVSVEYAKSGRSSCKGCSATIDKGALRLGASVRDPRGYDSTKWYHVACFPASSHPVGPVDEVEEFDSIKEDDREALRELEKNNKRGQTAVSPLEAPSPKKAKAHLSSPKAGVAEKESLSVEYAKSARSTCKGCNASIAKGALRIGVSAHDGTTPVASTAPSGATSPASPPHRIHWVLLKRSRGSTPLRITTVRNYRS